MFPQGVDAFLHRVAGRLSVQPLTLAPGQMIMGEVIGELNEREVVVRIAGQHLRAVAEVPLTTQKRHWFQVQADPHRLVLKVVTDGQPSSPQPVLPTASTLLRHWGVKVTKHHLQAVKWFIQQDRPFTPQHVTELASVWQELGTTTRVKQAVLLASSKHLPLNASTVNAIQQFLFGTPLPRQLNQLVAQLSHWLNTEQIFTPRVKAEARAVLRQITEILANSGRDPSPPLHTNDGISPRVPLATTPSVPATAEWLRTWLRGLGIERETNLARALISRAAVTAPGSSSNIKAAANVKESLMRLLHVSLPVHIRETAETTLHQITGQQLLLSMTDETQWQHVLLHLPLAWLKNHQASIHVLTRQQADGTWDKDNCRLLFQLELERLGPTWLFVEIVSRIIHIEWHSAADIDTLSELISRFEPDLRQQLQEYGYNLSGVSVKTRSEPGKERNEQRWPFAYARAKGVDIRI